MFFTFLNVYLSVIRCYTKWVNRPLKKQYQKMYNGLCVEIKEYNMDNHKMRIIYRLKLYRVLLDYFTNTHSSFNYRNILKSKNDNIVYGFAFGDGSHHLIKNAIFKPSTEYNRHYLFFGLRDDSFNDYSRFLNKYRGCFTEENDINTKEFLSILCCENIVPFDQYMAAMRKRKNIEFCSMYNGQSHKLFLDIDNIVNF